MPICILFLKMQTVKCYHLTVLMSSVLKCHCRVNVYVQVEEKPDVTYSDVGGCKEQIEKLREVVEVPLLHV